MCVKVAGGGALGDVEGPKDARSIGALLWVNTGLYDVLIILFV